MHWKAIYTSAIALIVLISVPAGGKQNVVSPNISTFSIVGYDPVTQELGVAVQSKIVAVGAIVPFARAGVGAIATQSFANTTYGPKALSWMEQRKTPKQVKNLLLSPDFYRDFRQFGIVNAKGQSVTYTGSRCHSWAGGLSAPNVAVQGNILTGKKVVQEMFASFQKSKGRLADRLVQALAAGQAAGGDKRGRQSASLLVVRKGWGYGGQNDRFRDIRVDDHPTPIQELARILKLHQKLFRRPKVQRTSTSKPTKTK